jgi:hypothetical protein
MKAQQILLVHKVDPKTRGTGTFDGHFWGSPVKYNRTKMYIALYMMDGCVLSCSDF